MIPLRDHNPSQNTPFVTYLLLFLNIGIFLYMFLLPGESLDAFILQHALIPREISNGQDLITLLTAMFLHGGIGHIVGNMIFLHIFGDNLEDALGHIKFLLFYLVCGLAASALQIFTDPGSTIPNLGASGAIAGLMGGYLVLFPNHKVDVLLPIGGFLNSTTVPAFSMLLYWIFFQFINGFGQIGVEGGGVAYWAHIGGFVAGLILIFLMRPFTRPASD